MSYRVWAAALFLLLARTGSATESRVQLLGHNLTPTSYSLRKSQLMLGTYAVGYGLTDRWTIATSPWMIFGYNMPMVVTRIATSPGNTLPRIALELSYFKSIPMLMNWYQQESVLARVTNSVAISPSHVLHMTLGYQYFFDHTKPFSLRMSPGETDSPHTLSASVLTVS